MEYVFDVRDLVAPCCDTDFPALADAAERVAYALTGGCRVDTPAAVRAVSGDEQRLTGAAMAVCFADGKQGQEQSDAKWFHRFESLIP